MMVSLPLGNLYAELCVFQSHQVGIKTLMVTTSFFAEYVGYMNKIQYSSNRGY